MFLDMDLAIFRGVEGVEDPCDKNNPEGMNRLHLRD